jgi:iron complex transport system permease protein
MGSLGQAQWSTLLAVTSLMVPTVLDYLASGDCAQSAAAGRRRGALSRGRCEGRSAVLLLCSALLVAAAVAISGVIGFVGLVVPHLMRMWLGPTTGP